MSGPATRIAITGCSGGGKSTLLAALEARGHTVFEEPERRAVRAGFCPVTAPLRFAIECLELAEADWHAAPAGLSFYDRSALDALIWFLRSDTPVPERFSGVARGLRYAQTVIFAPPWQLHFAQDEERRHGWTEALEEVRALEQHLPRLGYRWQVLPKMPVAARVTWVEARIAEGMWDD